MKKLFIITISIIIILALSSSVMAKAVQLELPPYPNSHETGLGKVILNNPRGAINFIVQVNLENAETDFTYTVWIQAKDNVGKFVVFPCTSWEGNDPLNPRWYNLGEFTTDELGNGSFHINLKLEYTGVLSNIIIALDAEYDKYIKYWSGEGEIEIK